jgi:hypothetical protein
MWVTGDGFLAADARHHRWKRAAVVRTAFGGKEIT